MTLEERRRKTIELAEAGMSRKEIAAELGVSTGTIRLDLKRRSTTVPFGTPQNVVRQTTKSFSIKARQGMAETSNPITLAPPPPWQEDDEVLE